MKTKKIVLALLVLVCVFTMFGTVSAVTFPSLTTITKSNIEAYNYDKTDYPDLRGKTFTMMVYAYMNPPYGKGVGNNSNLPKPFNVYHSNDGTGTQTFYTGWFYNEEEGRYNAYLLYCSGYRVPINSGAAIDTQVRVYDWENKEMSEETKNLISLALMYGFDANMGYGSYPAEATGMIRNDTNKVGGYIYGHVTENFATQMVVWLASTNQIGTEHQDAILRHFCSINGVLDEYAYSLCNSYIAKIQTALKFPSYSSTTEAQAPVYEMKWNPDTARFEYKLNDTNGLNTAEKVAIKWHLQDTGINAEVNGNEVTLWTNEIIGTKDSPVTLTAEKVINNGVGVAGFWQNPTYNNGSPSQPMTRLMGIARTPEYSYIKVYTSGIRIGVEKVLKDINGNYGNATVEGCTFGVYRDEACTDEVATLTIGADGKSDKTEYVPYQTYYVKEKKSNASTLTNNKVYVVDPSTATTDEDGDFVVYIKAENNIVPTQLLVVKQRDEVGSTEENPAVGAVLRLTLVSDTREEYHLATVNAEGTAEFTNIPYGTYLLTEDDTNSNYYIEIDPEEIEMVKNMNTYTYRVIVTDKEVETHVRILKVDSVTKERIKIAGAKFKFWDCINKEWVTQLDTSTGKMIDEFVTNSEGEFISPQEFEGGEYVAYETEAPKGYYLNPKYAVPENEADLGNLEVAGVKVSLTNQIVVEEDERGNLIYTVPVENEPLKGKIQVIKTGEMLTDIETDSEII
ncbi:MAG: hypothetical protein J6A15_02830, partial [Clostridia bacterium]|nr:hypothetical protein [Clostridia bacterium]